MIRRHEWGAIVGPLIPLAGVLLFDWSVLAYLLVFVLDTLLAAGAAIARRLRLGLFDIQLDPGSSWVERLDLYFAPVLALLLFAGVMAIGVLGFLWVLLLPLGLPLDALGSLRAESLWWGVLATLLAQSAMALAPASAQRRVEMATALREEKRAMFLLALFLMTTPLISVLSLGLGHLALLLVAALSAILRIAVSLWTSRRPQSLDGWA